MQEICIGWSALLAIDLRCVAAVSSILGFSLARECHQLKLTDRDRGLSTVAESSDSSTTIPVHFTKPLEVLRRPHMKKVIYVLAAALSIAALVGIQTNLHMLWPSWIWNPFLLGYNVYWPSSISSAMNGLCVDDYLKKAEGSPLCLSERMWKELSTDALTSKNEDDVNNVMNGVKYLKGPSSGIVFAIMARDTVKAIKPLRDNVESLLSFTPNIAVVVFENDSTDGTRQAFFQWAEAVKGKYIVDVIECEDYPGCKFKELHRDKKDEFEKTSAVGRMGEFRQRVVDHVLNDTKYVDYSHLLVLDIDLSVSISPLGILHSLGVKPEDSIASSGRQARPGSFGSLVPPYDFSAFVPHATDDNKRMIALNKQFCALKPEGYRWRNECTAVSVAQFMMIQTGDKLNGGKPYAVDSAFNGAVLYPLKLVRETKAKYDAGNDGQRCEHVGFNLSMKRNMYINPKWDMHLHPHLMGGPSGERAIRTVRGIATSPKIIPFAFGQNILSIIIFTYCIITLTMLIVYPLWVCVSRSTIGGSVLPNTLTIRERSKSPSMKEMEFLLDLSPSYSSRKRKDSESDKGDRDQPV